MNNLKTKVLLALAGLTLTGASVLPATTALADSTDKNISTKISFEQATKTALKEAKTGKITQIELENKKNKPVYEVTILDDKTEKEYKINGNRPAKASKTFVFKLFIFDTYFLYLMSLV